MSQAEHLFFYLEAPPVGQTYEQALIVDAMKYGIGKGLDPYSDSVGMGCYIMDNGVVLLKKKKVTLEDVEPIFAPSAATSVPRKMETGGYVEPAIPAHATARIAPPLSSHYAAPPTGGHASLPASGQPSSLSGPPQSHRPRWEMAPTETFYVIQELTDHDILKENFGSIGYSLVFQAASLKNIQQFKNRSPGTPKPVPEWEPLLNEAKTGPQPLRLTLDTASSVSWTFCNLPANEYQAYDATSRWDQCDFDATFEYNTKPNFPRPPADMMESNQRTLISYGVVEAKGRVCVTNSVCQLRIPNMPQHTFDMYPIGLALGSDPSMLWRVDDGVLALGTGSASHYRDPRGLRWPPKPFHKFLAERKKIPYAMFWISFGHPNLDRGAQRSTFIVFGNFYHPAPWAGLDMKSAIRVPCPVTSEFRYLGQWVLDLKSIAYVPTNGGAEKVFDVQARVILDTGASQSYLMVGVADAINKYVDDYAPHMDWRDQVKLVFTDVTGKEYKIRGQAKRFFTGVLPCNELMRTPTIGTIGDMYLLGLNLFRTFIVGFDETGGSGITFHYQPFVNWPTV